MKYKYRGINIDYEVIGEGKPLVMLHGWGQSKNTFKPLINDLTKMYKIYLIDLIGFGKSEEPFKPLNIHDYVLFLYDFITREKIISPIILGHSFGGRIAIGYAANFSNIDKLILVDSAGIKKHKSINKLLKIYIFKFKKMWYKKTKNIVKYNKLVSGSGSYDYKMASPMMKATLSKVIKQDLIKQIKKIKCETLIIWGRYDTETPYKDALKMHNLIKNSGLVTIESGHFPYLECKEQFKIILKNYLKVTQWFI